jgi:hypothetical protein
LAAFKEAVKLDPPAAKVVTNYLADVPALFNSEFKV